MSDPVSRAAKRQNLLDELGEHLTTWGCPPDTIGSRALALLHTVEQHGWSLPTVDAPPLAGYGSTAEGRTIARLIARHSRLGCRCEPWRTARALPPAEHPSSCPVSTQPLEVTS
jgi:hypothetical protein